MGFVFFFFSHPFIILVVQIQGSMPPGTQAEGSDRWGDLAEGSRRETNIWLSSQPEFTDQQLTVKAPFGSHSRKHCGWLKILISQCAYWIQGGVRLWDILHDLTRYKYYKYYVNYLVVLSNLISWIVLSILLILLLITDLWKCVVLQ